MDILAKARRLESQIARRIDRAAQDFVRPGAREPLEIAHAVVDAVEQQVQPGARGTRVFPFTAIALSVVAPTREARAQFEALFAGPPTLRDRIVDRLDAARCRDAAVTLDIHFVARASKSWGRPDFHLSFSRQPEPVEEHVTAGPGKPARIELSIVRGEAERRSYSLNLGRIDLGRRAEVRDKSHRLIRTNHVAFVDGSDAASQSVSRQHAHITRDAKAGEYRLHDDGSAHGTGVVRDGRTLVVPRGARGVRLHSGDEIVLGDARIRVKF